MKFVKSYTRLKGVESMVEENNKYMKFGRTCGTFIKEICYLLTTLFCVFRACDIISWAWYWIMSPIFFSWIIAFGCFVVATLLREL